MERSKIWHIWHDQFISYLPPKSSSPCSPFFPLLIALQTKAPPTTYFIYHPNHKIRSNSGNWNNYKKHSFTSSTFKTPKCCRCLLYEYKLSAELIKTVAFCLLVFISASPLTIKLSTTTTRKKYLNSCLWTDLTELFRLLGQNWMRCAVVWEDDTEWHRSYRML